ncbi:MAG: hypothetical protein EPO21_18290 [Chloroflexota bacterium]|nr:MAG: hypothetical protein EPO21_18290 [Chloroflexota bacterium]
MLTWRDSETRSSNTTRSANTTPTSNGSFMLNFFPASFNSDTIAVLVGPYGDERAYSQLVAAQDGWTAWRDTDDGARVYVWCHDEATTFTRDRFQPATVTLAENPPLFCRVMLDGIGRHLQSRGFMPANRNAYANWSVGNLLTALEVPGFVPDQRVGLFPKIIVASFITRFTGQEPVVGLIIDIAYTTRLDVPVSELLTTGFDVRGRYVKPLWATDVGGTFADRAVGRVARVDGTRLVLDDLRDRNLEQIDSASCVLVPDRSTLQDYLRHLHPRHFRAVQPALQRKLTNFIAPKEKLRLIEGFAGQRLVGVDGETLPLASKLSVRFGPAVNPTADADTFRATELLAPAFSFDPESAKTSPHADAGLNKYGPYSRIRMQRQTPRILVLAPQSFQGHVEHFVQMFQGGVRGYERTYNGFRMKYRLTGLQVMEHYFHWDNQPAKDAYYNAAVHALDETTDYALCFVVISEDFKKLPPSENPYFVCKALLLSFGITVQDVRVETLRQPEASLQWTVNTIALASYAKLGGAPFVLRTRQLRHHELVFGIGRSIERAHGSRLGAAQQIIGFTTVFRSDGDYVLNACTPYTDFTNYARRLEEVVLRSVTEVAETEGIGEGETIRLIFHVYKRTGRREVDAIQNAIAKLTRYRIEFALLHVNDSHDFKLFDRTNPGSSDQYGRLNESAALIPPRRLMVEIGPRERLVNFIGPQQYRRRGTPAPVRFTLDRASTFRDLDYLVQQAYDFSLMSWRSFNPGTQPVTVFYSELMAGMNSRLRQLVPWNQEIIKTKLKRKLWFI